jgi:hypothetical protein
VCHLRDPHEVPCSEEPHESETTMIEVEIAIPDSLGLSKEQLKQLASLTTCLWTRPGGQLD